MLVRLPRLDELRAPLGKVRRERGIQRGDLRENRRDLLLPRRVERRPTLLLVCRNHRHLCLMRGVNFRAFIRSAIPEFLRLRIGARAEFRKLPRETRLHFLRHARELRLQFAASPFFKLAHDTIRLRPFRIHVRADAVIFFLNALAFQSVPRVRRGEAGAQRAERIENCSARSRRLVLRAIFPAHVRRDAARDEQHGHARTHDPERRRKAAHKTRRATDCEREDDPHRERHRAEKPRQRKRTEFRKLLVCRRDPRLDLAEEILGRLSALRFGVAFHERLRKRSVAAERRLRLRRERIEHRAVLRERLREYGMFGVVPPRVCGERTVGRQLAHLEFCEPVSLRVRGALRQRAREQAVRALHAAEAVIADRLHAFRVFRGDVLGLGEFAFERSVHLVCLLAVTPDFLPAPHREHARQLGFLLCEIRDSARELHEQLRRVPESQVRALTHSRAAPF